jgi:hypothetical protein
VSERLDEWTCAQGLRERAFEQVSVHRHLHTVFSLQRQQQSQLNFEIDVDAWTSVG